ncbi:hypothetical protein AKJ09_03357 [Labilithrix luteola]|uniref:SnoaL-like domain-containing protein n=1 Tax=Labilithrix luteola TaxID=1391654 RepID=A0A0K1PT31_9BACT|nr:nuclear transport factor 2 family protein [Labilithrix luteola]AKU96693.1 hypothetical protein AKJ09_03357 [Labilithrix luteola]
MTDSTTRASLELLERHLALVLEDPEAWYALFDENVVVEFPFAVGTSVPPRLVGKQAMREYFGRAGKLFGPFTFSDVRVHASLDPGVVIAEVHGSSIARPTGKAYEQDYVMVLTAEDGKIVRYREYWNPVVAHEAFALEQEGGR